MASQGTRDMIGLDTSLVLPRGHLSEHIELFLARRIVSGELPPGAALPSQDDLVRQFGVSRAVVRQAVSALALRGLLNIRHGRNTFVADQEMWNVLDPFLVGVFTEVGSVRKILQDLFSTRLIMEPEAAAVVAANHSDRQLGAIRETVERLERLRAASSRDLVVRADRDFHWHLASATGNQVLTSIMRSVEALLWRQFGLAATLFDPQDRVLRQHRAVYQALETGDSDAAREVMRVHLTDARDRLLQALPS